MSEETDNQKIHEWLGRCWHQEAYPFDGQCMHCGRALVVPLDGSGEPWNENPAYSTDPAACLELIEAVRAKGMASIVPTAKYAIQIYISSARGYYFSIRQAKNTNAIVAGAEADTLPAAVAAAVLALIEKGG